MMASRVLLVVERVKEKARGLGPAAAAAEVLLLLLLLPKAC